MRPVAGGTSTGEAATNAAGVFEFPGVPPGNYRVLASKEGFSGAAWGAEKPTQPGRQLTIKAAEVRTGIQLQLQRLGAMQGQVLDEEGDPVTGAQVQLIAAKYPRGKRLLTPMASSMTDDRGVFRLFNLQAGTYHLRCEYKDNRRRVPQPEGMALPGYGTLYYPSASRASASAALRLEAGQELRDLNFRLQPQRTVKVRVRVTGALAELETAPVMVQLLGDEENSAPTGSGSTQFAYPPEYLVELETIPGPHRLVAAAQSQKVARYRRAMMVQVSGGEEITVALEPPVAISGSLVVEGAGSDKYREFRVQLISGDIPSQGFLPPVRVEPGKPFTIPGVAAGIWDINVDPVPQGGYLKAMTLGAEDVLAEEMAIGTATPAALKIVVSTQGAKLRGTVEPPGPAVVLLAPEKRFRHVFSFYRMAVADERGAWKMDALMPGEYGLLAFDQMEVNAWFDPGFLPPFEEHLRAVQLREGEEAAVKLQRIELGSKK